MHASVTRFMPRSYRVAAVSEAEGGHGDPWCWSLGSGAGMVCAWWCWGGGRGGGDGMGSSGRYDRTTEVEWRAQRLACSRIAGATIHNRRVCFEVINYFMM